MYDVKQARNQVKLSWGNCNVFRIFVQFSLERFGEESDMADAQSLKEMRNQINYFEKQGWLHTLTLRKGNKIFGVEYACYYKGVYYLLNGGYDTSIRNLGKLLILEHINHAFELKAKKIDLLSGKDGWKELWNFEKEPYYVIEKQN